MSNQAPGPWKLGGLNSQLQYEILDAEGNVVLAVKGMGNARLVVMGPVLFDIAKLTKDILDNGLADVSPEAKKFRDTISKIIATVEDK